MSDTPVTEPEVKLPPVLTTPMSTLLKEAQQHFETCVKIPPWWSEHTREHACGNDARAEDPSPFPFIVTTIYIGVMMALWKFFPHHHNMIIHTHLILVIAATGVKMEINYVTNAKELYAWMLKYAFFLPSTFWLTGKEFYAWTLSRNPGAKWNSSHHYFHMGDEVESLINRARLRDEFWKRTSSIDPILRGYAQEIRELEPAVANAKHNALKAREHGYNADADAQNEYAVSGQARIDELKEFICNQDAYDRLLRIHAYQLNEILTRYAALAKVTRQDTLFATRDPVTDERLATLRGHAAEKYLTTVRVLHAAKQNLPAPAHATPVMTDVRKVAETN